MGFLGLSILGASAQLTNTKWTGKAGEMTILWTFAKDTTGAVTLPDSISLGTMTFSVKDSVVSFRKIEGRLPCDAAIVGRYKFTITGNKLLFTLISDDCAARSQSIDGALFDRITDNK